MYWFEVKLRNGTYENVQASTEEEVWYEYGDLAMWVELKGIW